MNTPTHYDIIADIHGRFDKLDALMELLGYTKSDDGYIPPAGHKALFLGDLIDPKPGYFLPGGVKATLNAVKAMCDRGDALCLMGNHELNAIYFHTADPDGRSHDPDRNWLRYRGSKNRAMHQGTLDDFPDHDDPGSEWHQVWMPWMKALPFFLDLGGLRAVHAAWHPEMIDRVAEIDFQLPDQFFACVDKNTPEGEAVETLLKGIEVPLPEPHFFLDHTGTPRKQFRARWWELPHEGMHGGELVFPANHQIKPVPITEEARRMFRPYPADAPPVFFGHYLKPADSPAHPECHNVACLDHSAAIGGPLVAYRWKGEARIKPEHYVASP